MDKKTKILLVEDDNLLVRLYQDKLERDGYEVDVALNGEECLAKAEEGEKPDLILLDVMMPKMDGFETLKHLKAHPDKKNIPVILLTNLGGEDDAKRGLEMGAVAYMIKSDYTPDEVVTKVKEIIAGYTRDNNIPKAAEKK